MKISIKKIQGPHTSTYGGNPNKSITMKSLGFILILSIGIFVGSIDTW
jgi:hypothetical protein